MAKEKQETESEIINETDTTTELTVEDQGKELISQTKTNLNSSNLIKEFEREQLKKQLPEIYVGDTVKVGVKITEGNKERVQPYEGVVIAKRHGGLNQTITVKNPSNCNGLIETTMSLRNYNSFVRLNPLFVTFCNFYSNFNRISNIYFG